MGFNSGLLRVKSVTTTLTALHKILKTLTVAELVKKNCPLFIQPRRSSPYTQHTATCPSHESDKSILQISFYEDKLPLQLYVLRSRV